MRSILIAFACGALAACATPQAVQHAPSHAGNARTGIVAVPPT